MSDLYADDPDIGRCDDCGSDDGRRRRVVRVVDIGGHPRAVAVWLCEDGGCWQDEMSRR